MSLARTVRLVDAKEHVSSAASRELQRLALRSNRAVLSHISSLEQHEETGWRRSPEHAGRHLENKHVTALKDNFVTTDLPTTCASDILRGYTGPQKSTVAHLLDEAGVTVVAKTNMDEFGMGSHSTNSAFGPVENGFGKHAQSAGGSSGGSAMVVADMKTRVAIASDTGGSVRLPAAYTATIGFKPSYGRISRNGLVPYANSLDTVGILSRTVADTLSVYKILNKYDPADPTSLNHESRRRIEHALMKRALTPRQEQEHAVRIRTFGQADRFGNRDLSLAAKNALAALDRPKPSTRTITIGVPDEYNIEEMHPLVRQAWTKTLSHFFQLGHDIVPISLPTTQQALPAYYVLAPAEASSNLAKYDGVRYGTPRDQETPDNFDGPLYSHYRGQHFGREVKRRILLGTFTLSAGAMDNYFLQAQKVRRLVQYDFNAVFKLGHPLMDNSSNNPGGVDFICVPTAPTPPPLISEVAAQSPLDSYVNDVFTVPASLAGLPAISMPVFDNEDIPHNPDRNIGMQIIAQFGDDTNLLKFARQYSEALDPVNTSGLRTWTRWRM